MTRRTRRDAQNFADTLAAQGVEGWIVVSGPTTWYGPYKTRAQARARLRKLDTLDMSITGTVIWAGRS